MKTWFINLCKKLPWLTIELETVPDDDSQWSILFTVPRIWLKRWVRKHYQSKTTTEFLDSYSWDETYFTLMAAEADGMVLQKQAQY